MEKKEFISRITNLGEVESVTGVNYRIVSINDKYILGTRLSTLREFKIETDKLYRAYCDISNGVIQMTTTALCAYVNRTQSPALAIIKSLRKQ